VVSFQVKNSKIPEDDANQMLEAWGKPRGIFEDPTRFQIFGFNNPWGPEGELWGYELWVVIPDDFDPGDDVLVKHFPGGKYAMATLLGVHNIGRQVGSLPEVPPDRFRMDYYVPITDKP
jgi:DNA gyrase inhibitor GyrI